MALNKATRLGCAAAFLAAFAPVLAALLVLVPPRGFVWALGFSNAYYRLPRRLFGPSMFPVHEFGVVPTFAGTMLTAILYGGAAFVVVYALMSLGARGRSDR